MYYYQSLTEQGRLGAYTDSQKVANHQGWLNNAVQESDTEIAHDGSRWMKADASKGWTGAPVAPPPPSLHEQALSIQLTKREFLKLVIGLTATFPTPITLATIEAYVAGADENTRLEWTYANHIERNHPMLDTVSASFGISSEMLDTMFVNKDELLRKIDAGEPLHEEPQT